MYVMILVCVDEEEEEKEKRKLEDGRPAWMRTLSHSLSTWLKLLPKVRAKLAYELVCPTNMYRLQSS